jgi:adenylate cyclase
MFRLFHLFHFSVEQNKPQIARGSGYVIPTLKMRHQGITTALIEFFLKCFGELRVFIGIYTQQLMEKEYLTINDSCPIIADTTLDTEKELAILFLDIRNFTGLMEAQSGQSVIQVVRRLFTAFNQIIKNFQGKVVEIAGDNLYAVFGLQTNVRDAANNAYQATKMMFKTVNMFNAAYAEPYYGGPLEIGVGLNTGKVFVGEFAIDGPPVLSVMGLPVNIASRLQAKTKELNNDLIISENAYSLLDNDGATFEQQTVRLQGIAQGQQIRLAGKPYNNGHSLIGSQQNMDYLLAISG